jgi:hypothetical protein
LARPQYAEITPESLIDEFGILAAGERDGKAKRAPQSGSKLSGAEAEAYNSILTARQRATEQYQQAIRNHEDFLNALGSTFHSGFVTSAGASLLADLKSRARGLLDEVGNQQKTTQEDEAALHAFRTAHKRGADAVLNTRPVPTKLAVFGSIFFAETLMNGFFLSTKLVGGLYEGVVMAFAIALVNMLLSFLLGFWCLRYLKHENPVPKGVAVLFTLLGFVALLTLNLGIGHLRTLLSQGTGDALRYVAAEAFARVWTMGFNLGDYFSYVLLGLGFLCSIGAALSGYWWDEPYPGYGQVTRKRDASVKKLLRQKNDALADLDEALADALQQLDATRDAVRRNTVEYTATLDALNEIHAGYKVYVAGLQESLNAACRAYHQSYLDCQGGAGECRFAKEQTIESVADRDFTTGRVTSDELKATVAAAGAEYAQELRGIRDAHSAAHQTLHNYASKFVAEMSDDTGSGADGAAPQQAEAVANG